MFFKRGKRIEEKLDMILKVVLDTQMTIQTRGEDQQKKREAMGSYLKTMKEMLAAKGLDTSMFDQIETIIGLKK
jgi:hypothetical protein